MKPKVLIIDDDNLVCISLSRILTKLNYKIETCLDGGKVHEFVEKFDPDIILLDIYIKTYNGLDILKELKGKVPDIPIIMITAFSDVKISVEAMKNGAFDFLLKPVDIDKLRSILEKCKNYLSLRQKSEEKHELSQDGKLYHEYFGRSSKIKKVLHDVEKLAASDDTTVLLLGESGTGKEVFAKYLHQLSPRKEKVFININCGTIPKELAESELFGYEKGAFTGAVQNRKLGKFELANGGTILLDEIGELGLDIQVKLLRILQEKKFYRVGGEKEISVDVRIIAATNKNLEQEVEYGNFRQDLFYRLNVAPVIIPALRERVEDIKIICYTFIEEFSKKFKKNINSIDSKTFELLSKHQWKGNIRELRNVMERAILMMESDTLLPEHFDFMQRSSKNIGGGNKSYILEIPETGIGIDVVNRDLIIKTLKITNGNQAKAAKMLDMSRAKFRHKIETLKIEINKLVK